jgi:small redox-active disulfide protein 2
MKIEIFGIGCESCRRLEENARTAVSELGIEAEIIKVEDFEALIRRGITATPGLFMDGEVVSLGRVPSVEEIKELIGSKKREVIPSSRPRMESNANNRACGCSSKEIMIYPCSGGSNVGQVSNEAAKVLVERGWGKFSCLAGVGAQNNTFIDRAKKAKVVLAIDGCGLKCASRTLERASINPTVAIVITDLGTKKDTSVLSADQKEVETVVMVVEEKIRQLPPGS